MEILERIKEKIAKEELLKKYIYGKIFYQISSEPIEDIKSLWLQSRKLGVIMHYDRIDTWICIDM